MNFEATKISKSSNQALPLSDACHISCLKSNQVWVSNKNGDIILTDEFGKEYSKMKCISGYGIHSVGDGGDLVFINPQGNISKVTPDLKTKTFIKIEKGKATCIYFSKLNGDILVVATMTGPNPKIIRYTLAGHEVSEIEFDEHGEPLYEDPWYVTENANGDVCTLDHKKAGIIVVDKFGKRRFTYNASPLLSELAPLAICTDKDGRIIVYDDESESIHVIEKDGKFRSHLKTNVKEDITVSGLCVDYKGHLWTIDSDNKLTVYTYHQIEDGDWPLDFGQY